MDQRRRSPVGRRSFRGLLTWRWVGFTVLVAVLAYTCAQLGLWQLRRADERHQENVLVTDNMAAPPLPAVRLLPADDGIDPGLEYRLVTATGRYDRTQQILVRYRTRDGVPGFGVVTPLQTSTGIAVLVDRGWIPASANADRAPAATPPDGRVSVTGRVRLNQSGDRSALVPRDGQVRLVSGRAIETTLPYPAYSGYVELIQQRPREPGQPAPVPPPEVGPGPHLAYALQWFFFAGLALTGWGYFGWQQVSGRTPTGARPPADDRADLARMR